MRLFTQHVVRGDFWVPAYVNYDWRLLILKTEVGGKQGHALGKNEAPRITS